MSLPWIMEQPWRRRRVALVGGGFSYEFRQHLLSSAAGLGIDLIVLDKPGHWIQHHVRETGLVTEFQEVDLTVDNDLADRIVAAVKRCSLLVDGLTTFTDCFLCPTAKAATVLKLPAMPVNALEKSVDKALMRNLIPIPVAPNSLANRNGRDEGELDHPLIVKPARGGGSFGVHLATTREELQAALGSVQGFGKEPVIERYIGGPEVDVDVVLQDGRVLFVEVSDNLPTTAEGFPSPLGRPSWAETSIISPSGLPSDELKQLGRVISSHLLDLGYSTGLIHCEARVQRSKRAYRPDSSGYPSLRDVDGAEVGDPQICLIEINPRSPGAKAAVQSAYATGVDFQGLQLLAACGDTERLSALAHPFSKPKEWWGSGYIAAETGGKFSPVTLFEELQSTAPALMKYVVDWTVFFKPGDIVGDPADTGEFLSVAWFLACTDVSRAHLESILIRVRESVKFTIA
ncbi:hypothetical protein QBC46DRAFT_385666 [Diplogelasinospora grovesii]|uniref:ATP-grasp domain-containing protein n=1 Tax=Diplogelasinospora grovesii TaxID=303347 RepID=A0AAN6N752_9PEZI|nr:hypothetical protein QBC46DRAFT_385666 [Diplogelasinospora grovesii]